VFYFSIKLRNFDGVFFADFQHVLALRFDDNIRQKHGTLSAFVGQKIVCSWEKVVVKHFWLKFFGIFAELKNAYQHTKNCAGIFFNSGEMGLLETANLGVLIILFEISRF
jgi:hypothetical protein